MSGSGDNSRQIPNASDRSYCALDPSSREARACNRANLIRRVGSVCAVGLALFAAVVIAASGSAHGEASILAQESMLPQKSMLPQSFEALKAQLSPTQQKYFQGQYDALLSSERRQQAWDDRRMVHLLRDIADRVQQRSEHMEEQAVSDRQVAQHRAAVAARRYAPSFNSPSCLTGSRQSMTPLILTAAPG